jgi:hypothetical protein
MNPLLQRATGLLSGTVRQSERIARRVASESWGIVQQARSMRQAPKPDMDDNTLKNKVETEIFRPVGSPKRSVNVNVVNGVVFLRGEVKRPEQIRALEARALKIPEVRGVENLLKLPKTPSPTRADSPRSVQKNPRAPRPAPRKRTSAVRTRTTAEVPAGVAASGAPARSRTAARTPGRTRTAPEPPSPADTPIAPVQTPFTTADTPPAADTAASTGGVPSEAPAPPPPGPSEEA